MLPYIGEKMENNNLIIILLLLIVILSLSIGILFLHQSPQKPADVKINQSENDTIAESSSTPDSITVELPEFDKTYTKSAGEYTVKASKCMGSSVGGFDVYLYKNGKEVYKDSYMSRAYFYMDGEWKWSDWGNGQGAEHHKYPVSNGVKIQKVEVKF